jgi:hypothetical protein
MRGRYQYLRVLVTCFLGSNLAFPTASSFEQHQHLSGSIVAYARPLACLNGNTYWAMIIHLETRNRVGTDFIKVDFSLPCTQEPSWLHSKLLPQEFDLIRDQAGDVILNEFMSSMDLRTGKESQPGRRLPLWTRTPGNEQARLPFGSVVRCYRSVGLPLLPVV